MHLRDMKLSASSLVENVTIADPWKNLELLLNGRVDAAKRICNYNSCYNDIK